ncbi:MAG TPA: MopE-related protein [Chitinophagales bacterium]|nr:MopE-related protein [Chitinophagales bacterium]HRG29656.1 MopE-related protein [Chitinophagales bacterium]HRG87287.1 MopE-related protein [Chitinophagales bacterium]HRH54510.1 MopE-related protein [Chitinophagales bacterium]
MRTLVIITTAFALLLPAIVSAQAGIYPDILWERNYGGTASDYLQDACATSDSGYLLFGQSRSIGDDVGALHGGQDYWLLKIDSVGNTVWNKTYGGADDEYGIAIMQSSNNNFVISGITYSDGTGDVVNNFDDGWEPYSTDTWNVRIDNLGSIQWSENYGGSKDDGPDFLYEAFGQKILTVGYSMSNSYMVDGNNGYSDFYIFLTDSNGSVEWSVTLGSSSYDYAYGATQLADSNFLIVGHSGTNNLDFAGGYGASEGWLVLIDKSGEVIWKKNYGGSAADDLLAVMPLNSDDLILSGYSMSSDFDLNINYGGFDFWIMRTDSIGNVQWSTSLGTAGWDLVKHMEISDSTIYVCGYNGGNSGVVTDNHGSLDFWLVALDFYGNILWHRSYGGTLSDVANNIIINPDKTMLLSGVSYSNNGDVGAHYGTSTYSDFWVIKLSEPCMHAAWYADEDGDSYGNVDIVEFSCTAIPGFVSDSTDCNDTDSLVNLMTTDICNNLDDNCNGIFDEDALAYLWYFDGDSDSYGDATTDSVACFTPIGYTADSTDCDDTDSLVNLLAIDLCNNLDDNCNGIFDEDALAYLWYFDGDSDSYGDATTDSVACFTPIGYTADSTDCDDTNNMINIGAIEICNAFDDNCNTIIDEGLPTFVFFADFDADTFGNADSTIESCFGFVIGFVSDSTDCNDTMFSIFPGAVEVCNYLDDDCDILIDENLIYVWQFADSDNDYFGDALTDTLACIDIPGYVLDSTDCDDTNPDIYPGAIEILNGLDDDCNQISDEGLMVNNLNKVISIYPNPALDYIFIQSDAVHNITIYNLTGAAIQNLLLLPGLNSFSVQNYSSGAYLVKVDNNELLIWVKE